jgi:acyl-CoA thioesterase II
VDTSSSNAAQHSPNAAQHSPVQVPVPEADRHLDELLSLLDLEVIEVNMFRGRQTDEARLRTFGGLVAAQALVAAGRTVEASKPVHSLHAYFLRPGDPKSPILYNVDRIRDGRSFATRRVVAIQHGEAIFNLSASFHVSETGVAHQSTMPDAPDPETLPTFSQRYKRFADQDWYQRPRPIDLRHATEPVRTTTEARPPRQQVWFRPIGELPDDQLLHACIVAYASDMSLLDSIMLPHNVSWDDGSMVGMSLDHAMWFHRPFRASDWMLYNQESNVAFGARGLATGEIWTKSGELVVTVVQEGLIRLVRDRPGRKQT